MLQIYGERWVTGMQKRRAATFETIGCTVVNQRSSLIENATLAERLLFSHCKVGTWKNCAVTGVPERLQGIII
jgi:hypothetical protein